MPRPPFAATADKHADTDWIEGRCWQCVCTDCRAARLAGYEPKSTPHIIRGLRGRSDRREIGG